MCQNRRGRDDTRGKRHRVRNVSLGCENNIIREDINEKEKRRIERLQRKQARTSVCKWAADMGKSRSGAILKVGRRSYRKQNMKMRPIKQHPNKDQ